MWKMRFDWKGSNWRISLSRDGAVVAEERSVRMCRSAASYAAASSRFL